MPGRIRQLLEMTGLSQAQCAEAVGADPSRLTEWLAGIATPGAHYLRRFGDAFGVSTDWLLGYDVPVERDARREAGAVAEAFQQILHDHRPWARSDRWFSWRELGRSYHEVQIREATAGQPLAPSQEILRQAAAAWWRDRLRAYTEEWTLRLRELAVVLESEAQSGKHGDPQNHRSFAATMLHHVKVVRDETYLLERRADVDPVDAWRQLLELDTPRPASISGARRQDTRFLIIGGAFAYHYDGIDYVWYIDPESRRVTYLEGDLGTERPPPQAV